MLQRIGAIAALCSALVFAGCGSFGDNGIPFLENRTEIQSSDTRWKTFPEIKEAFTTIQNDVNTGKKVSLLELETAGFGPKAKNTTTINYLGIESMLLTNATSRDRLPDNLRSCTDKKELCYGVLVRVAHISRKGQENFFERLVTRDQTTIASGWRFEALFVLEQREDTHMVVGAYIQKEEPDVYEKSNKSDVRGFILDTLTGGLRIFGTF